tara:strand:- start:115 stop:585 length:471 start_codon:yes stop_codon:yes gene_type:complete
MSIYAETNDKQNLKIFAGEWKNKCFEKDNNIKKHCLLERAMFLDEKLKKRLVTILLRTNENTKDVFLTIISPLGTLIPKGVGISFDNKKLNEKAFGFNYCKQNGCFTNIIIKEKELELFKKSKALKLEYTLENQQSLSIDINLNEFSEAFNKITQF